MSRSTEQVISEATLAGKVTARLLLLAELNSKRSKTRIEYSK